MKTMKDTAGNEIPVKYVSKYNKETNRVVLKMRLRAEKMRAALESYLVEQLKDVETLKEMRGNNEIRKEGARGNMSVQSFDGMTRVSCVARYDILCDDRILTARDLMLEFIRSKIAGMNDDTLSAVLPIIEDAFRTSGSGSLSIARVMALMRIEIKDPTWQKAKKMLAESISQQRGRNYLNVETRPDFNHSFKRILLDASDCWPLEDGAANANAERATE